MIGMDRKMCPPGKHWKAPTEDVCVRCGHTGTYISHVQRPTAPPLNEGDKFDERKSRVDLVDPALMHYAALGLEYGAKKYSEWNWRKGIRYSKLYAALLRHLYAWWDGENIDRESGNPHLAHAACMLMMLIRFENDMRYDHLDNRCDVVPVNLSPVSDDPDPEDDYIQQPPGELEPVESREYSLHTNCLAKNCYCDQCMFKMRIEGGD